MIATRIDCSLSHQEILKTQLPFCHTYSPISTLCPRRPRQVQAWVYQAPVMFARNSLEHSREAGAVLERITIQGLCVRLFVHLFTRSVG